MSSVSAGFGFRPIYHPSGVIRPKALPGGIASGYATSIWKGDPVILATATGTLQAAAVENDVIGIFGGVQYTPTVGARMVFSPYWPASTTYVAGSLVAFYWEDPDLVYEVQANGSIAQAAIGDQADMVASNGSNVTGQSSIQLDSSLAGAGVQEQFRITGLALYPDNAWGDAFTIVQVQIAQHVYRANKVAI